MKKLITLLLILMIIPFVFAECPPDCPDSSSDDIDYSSPDDVNSMEPQDLASAIEQGKISDMSIVDDNKLSEALSNNPSISAKLEDGDLARAVNQDLSLLDNPSVISDFDSRAQSDTHILNDNPNIKKKWFADKGITDEGAELETYDGSTVKTKGSQATTFNINNHPGARVTKDGKLILSDGAEIESAEVTKADDGSINVNGGHTDLSNSQSANVHVNQGTAQVGDKIYTSADNTPVDVTIEDGKTTITGTNVVEAQDGTTTATFSGEVTTFEDGHKTFAKGTEYSPYIDGKKSKTYTVDGLTEYHTTANCDGSRNCIQDVDGNVRVISKNGNAVDIKSFDDSIKDLKVDEITDGSSVVFNDNGKVEMTFTKDPVTVKGDMTQLGTNVESYFTNADGEQYRQIYTNSGGVVQCSSERVCELETQIFNIEEVSKLENIQNPEAVRGAQTSANQLKYHADNLEQEGTIDLENFQRNLGYIKDDISKLENDQTPEAVRDVDINIRQLEWHASNIAEKGTTDTENLQRNIGYLQDNLAKLENDQTPEAVRDVDTNIRQLEWHASNIAEKGTTDTENLQRNIGYLQDNLAKLSGPQISNLLAQSTPPD